MDDEDYDADHAPDPERWLSMDESERLLAVDRYHARNPHPPAPSPTLHVGMHVIVESQIAAGDPPITAATLQRLIAEGLTRHEAVHAVAGAVSHMMFEMLKKGVPFDPVAYQRDLEQMSAAKWRASGTKPRKRKRR